MRCKGVTRAGGWGGAAVVGLLACTASLALAPAASAAICDSGSYGIVQVCGTDHLNVGAAFSGQVASYTVSATNPYGATGAHITTATIDWGDLTASTSGTITGNPDSGGTFTGTHTYAAPCACLITITVQGSAMYNGNTVTDTMTGKAFVTVVKLATGVSVSVTPPPPPNVFVTNAGLSSATSKVLKLAAGGGRPGTVAATGLNLPSGVALDAAGDVFIADTGNGRVVEVPAGGGAQTTVASSLNHPNGVAVDAAGDVLIADSGNNQVLKLPADGAPTTVGSGFEQSAGGRGRCRGGCVHR